MDLKSYIYGHHSTVTEQECPLPLQENPKRYKRGEWDTSQESAAVRPKSLDASYFSFPVPAQCSSSRSFQGLLPLHCTRVHLGFSVFIYPAFINENHPSSTLPL